MRENIFLFRFKVIKEGWTKTNTGVGIRPDVGGVTEVGQQCQEFKCVLES